MPEKKRKQAGGEEAAGSRGSKRPAKPSGKTEGTRVSTNIDIRSAGAGKEAERVSRDKLRDGT